VAQLSQAVIEHVRKMGKKVLLAVVTGASLLSFSAGGRLFEDRDRLIAQNDAWKRTV
jgi:triphosphoribosyl-dephospho-CoA synthetase